MSGMLDVQKKSGMLVSEHYTSAQPRTGIVIRDQVPRISERVYTHQAGGTSW